MSTPDPGGSALPTVHGLRWLSATGRPPASTVLEATDRTTAAEALRLAEQGTALLWRGDYHQARQLLTAMSRRLRRRAETRQTESGQNRTRRAGSHHAGTRQAGSGRAESRGTDPASEAFRRQREDQARRAELLGRLLVPLDGDLSIPLRRAPDARDALRAVHPPPSEPSVIALTELLGTIGAHQWRRRGIPLRALGGARIHPHYGVFAPTRAEYLDLVAQLAPPPGGFALDIGTGTGVLAALLARAGAARVLATDIDPRAVTCARDNLHRLGLADQVEVRRRDLFPEETAHLVVCNPPWLPADRHTPLDAAVYDPGSAVLRGFLAGLPDHLEPSGEGWLILSDLAERLGLRPPDELPKLIDSAGLRVRQRLTTHPRHGRAHDPNDPLYAARAAETVSLWRLAAR